MFYRLSKHLEFHQKYSAARRISTFFLMFGYPDETLSLVFDILHKNLEAEIDHISGTKRKACTRFCNKQKRNLCEVIVYICLRSKYRICVEKTSCLISRVGFQIEEMEDSCWNISLLIFLFKVAFDFLPRTFM